MQTVPGSHGLAHHSPPGDHRFRFTPLFLGEMEHVLRHVPYMEKAGDSSPSQPTYVGESEIYVKTLDVVQTFKWLIYLPNLDIQFSQLLIV